MFSFCRYIFRVSTGSSWFLLGAFTISIRFLPVPIPARGAAQPEPAPTAHSQPHHAVGQGLTPRAGFGGTTLRTKSPSCLPSSPPPRCPSLWPGHVPFLLLLKAKTEPGAPHPAAFSSCSLFQKSQKINSHLYAQATSL